MRPEFEQIINRLGRIRSRMEEYIMDKGGKTTGAETLMDYTNAICSIPDLGNVRNGYETFSGNTVLEEIPECLADASQHFTSMYKFCKDCTALKYVPRLYTENVTTFVYAFYGCTALQEIDLNVSSLTSQMDSTFTGCANLEVLEFTGTLRVDTWLSGAPKLTVVSLLSVIDSLADFSGTGTSKKITFGARNKAKLTAAQLALVTDKGWVLG